MSSVLDSPQFHNEESAYAHVEALLWPSGPVCPHCGNCDAARIGTLKGKTTRIGLRKCYECRKPFTVKMGTIFEDSHAPLRLWLQAIYLMCSSKKGISTRQLQRTLGVGMKTAWHMGHRIRLAMAPAVDVGPLGGEGKTVEADETVLSRSKKSRRIAPLHAKPDRKIMSLVERGGAIRSVYLDHKTISGVLTKHMDERSRLVTDGAAHYKAVNEKHESVDHSKFEFVRGDVHTNTLEGFFSIFKRGLVGVYQHMDKKHLDRYLAEFDFRQNTRAKLGINDTQRAEIALLGVKGKRLPYKGTDESRA